MADSTWQILTTAATAVCWGLFGLVWVAGAAYNTRKAPAARTRSTPSYAWVVGGVAIWLIFDKVPATDWRWMTVHWSWVRAFGLLVLLVATPFTLWARAVLGTMWTSAAVVKDHHALHTQGPYGITRHPIYTGVLGMILGTALLNGWGPFGAVFLVAVLVLETKIHTEEQLLTSSFGEEYERYRQRVPQLVPTLAPRRRRHSRAGVARSGGPGRGSDE
jgi:protein-S-isoprenylcysteine O-methyltransferase Ste14